MIDRSEESATDNASTESAMIEFAKAHRFDNIVLIQATSPLLTGADLDNGFNIFSSNGTDSVLSVVPQKRFIWEIDDEGNACAKNYDVYNRPRRQEFDEYYVENGAFYITSRKFDPWARKIPWRRAWQPTPVFLPAGSHGQRSLVGYSPECCKD